MIPCPIPVSRCSGGHSFPHHRKLKPAFSSSAVQSHCAVAFQLWSCRSWGFQWLFRSQSFTISMSSLTLSSLTAGAMRNLLRRCSARCFPPVSSQLSNIPAYFIISSPNSLLTVSSLRVLQHWEMKVRGQVLCENKLPCEWEF